MSKLYIKIIYDIFILFYSVTRGMSLNLVDVRVQIMISLSHLKHNITASRSKLFAVFPRSLEIFYLHIPHLL